MDDLSILELINLLTIGLTSFNIKQQIPNDINTHNQYIPAKNLKSQEWLDWISDWTEKQKMLINTKKTKTMVFNFTKNYQFTPRLYVQGDPIEVIEKTRLLGTIITSDLSWEQNTNHIVIKANSRMELIRTASSFGASIEDLKTIYKLFVRSQLEQSAVVWSSSLTDQNKADLERVQRSAVKVILGPKYRGYKKGLTTLNLETLEERRENLCLRFARKCVRNEKTKSMFPLNIKEHKMKTRNFEKYEVQHANTDRLRKSAIIYIKNLLNKNESQ